MLNLFVASINIITGATRILLREGLKNVKFCDVILMTHFGDVI